MKIGIVVHGPNIIDSGYALKIINILKDFGEVKAILGGTMGRTAVIDASLENAIDISAKKLPSDSVKLFIKENVDIIFLLNYGKSSITGHTFGFKVFNNSFSDHNLFNLDFDSHESNNNIGFIQIERPGEPDGSLISWKSNYCDIVSKLAKLLDLNVLKQEFIVKKYFSEDSCIVTEINNEKVRNIYGVSPNENIFVNGIVIGKSTSENLSLVVRNDNIVDIIGGTIKNHGVEKLGKINIDKAIVKTGLLRKSTPNPRIITKNNISNNHDISNNNKIDEYNTAKTENKIEDASLKVSFLDHAAEDIYNLKESDLVITIGDDTTLVASDILYRFNIPVIGITDGDLDKVVEKGFKAKYSRIIEVESGFDDIVGKAIFEEIFRFKNTINVYNNNYNFNSYNNNNCSDISKEKKIENFTSQILEIVNNITSKYIIKK